MVIISALLAPVFGALTNIYGIYGLRKRMLLAFMVGTVQGGAQALSRSLYGSMIPKSKTAEFFGFYGISSRIGGFAGPLIFAVVRQVTGNSRFSIISIVIFFIAGAALLTRVDAKEGVSIAMEENGYGG